jgi:hypothetical protein
MAAGRPPDRSQLHGRRFRWPDIPLALEVHRWHGLPQTRQNRPEHRALLHDLQAHGNVGVLDMALS